MKTLYNFFDSKLISNIENKQVDMNPVIKFIGSRCSHLAERVPKKDVQDWSAFDFSSLSNCNFPYWEEQVNALCLRYQPMLGDTIEIIKQYDNFKSAVMERFKAKLILNFPDIVQCTFNNEQFSDLSKLMDIGGAFFASSADCERGFSLMNSIKNKLRNRLGKSYLDMLMRIKSYQLGGGVIDLDKV